ncbi:MAG: ATP-dependent RNA helicase RhlB [Desulfotalea sp.]|nr:MAG: ATP-dependent RNA helicase RhlB [Desulfotalea sp.]
MKNIILSAFKEMKRIFQAGKQRFDEFVGAGEKVTLEEVGAATVTDASVTNDTAKDTAKETVKAEVRTKNAGQPPRKPREPAWTIDQFVVSPEDGKSRFHDFDIPLKIMRAIADQKFEYCTAIQEKALKDVLAGKDLVGKANTGTGKTAVFLLAIFSRLINEKKNKKRQPRALVLAPTRELVVQIAKDGQRFAKYSNLTVRSAYGGVDYQKQQELLINRTCDLLVATPGRLLDFVGKGIVDLSRCKILVLDEADRMLDMGFIPDVRRIIGRVAPKNERQTMMFSATVPDDVQRLASQWCVDPRVVEAEPEQVAVDTVEQVVYLTTAEEKYSVLYNLIQAHPDDRIIVFANMKNEAKKLAERLQGNAIDCVLLSGDVAQNKRMTRLERFREGKVKILVATDVAGRGIHIDGITFVVNYTLPYEPEDYVHRIGRTGRAGAEGKAVSFACEKGSFYLPDIEEYIGRKLECVMPEESLLVPAPKATVQPVRSSSGRPGQKQKPRPRRKSYPKKTQHTRQSDSSK